MTPSLLHHRRRRVSSGAGKLFEPGRGERQSLITDTPLPLRPATPAHAHARRAGDVAGGRIKSGRRGGGAFRSTTPRNVCLGFRVVLLMSATTILP
jgi:hypothetical protein